MEIVLGIIVGWLVPRLAVFGRIERAIWEPVKDRWPACRRWFS